MKDTTHPSRREFLRQSGLAAATIAFMALDCRAAQAGGSKQPHAELPWYRRAFRWGQTNITEIDPERYDVGWWRKYWRRTETQAIIINAGGIVAYYPSKVPLHRPAQYLGGRDLFGELCQAAHQDGVVVLARMDSNRAHEEFYRAHPDWFAVDAEGRPHKAGELFVSCINGPYYEEHIPSILREIAQLYHPEGFTDNSWSGLGRGTICYCQNCRRRFQDKAGKELPRTKDWTDPVYRDWIRWNYERRLEIWDLNNRTTKAAGGPNCIWAGMNSGSISGQGQSFRDFKAICERADIIMLDHQSRSDNGGFQNNAEVGKLIHGLLGWDKLVPESMAMYQAGKPTYRLSAKPAPEARMWMLEGIAGGLQPWWHHVAAYHEDRRAYHTAEPILRWHKNNQEFLINRQPLVTVGVVWSQQNSDFYGRDDAEVLVEQSFRGVTQALVRARIPFLPVHADHVARDASQFAALLLPNLAAVSDEQATAIRRFVENGGGLLATGETSLFDLSGERRTDFALAELFGAHAVTSSEHASDWTQRVRAASETAHSYLRLLPELRAQIDGPHIPDEPKVMGPRHEALDGFGETDILPFGGTLHPLRTESTTQVLATFVPSFPIYPPETAWMKQPKTDLPGLILNTPKAGGRVAFLPADIDRRFAKDNLPDHGDLLANLVRWVCKGNIWLQVEGAGLLDCHLYRQPSRLILHIVNLTSAGTWRQPTQELIPVGPIRVLVKVPPKIKTRQVAMRAEGKATHVHFGRGTVQFTIPSILDHQFVTIGD